MKVKQISVFLENKSGRLAQVTRVLGQAGINIRALSIADTADFGILRLIVNDPAAAYRTLKEAGYTVAVTDVVAVEVRDEPGGLAEVLKPLEENGVNIEYLYAFVQKSGDAAIVVIRAEKVDEAVEALAKSGVRILKEEEIYSL